VCKLKPDGNELSLPGLSKELAVAGNLLAMSIVQNLDTEVLQKEKVILEPLSISSLEASLKTILTKGDLVQSARIPKLELKNFGSLNQQRAQYTADAEKAFEHALDLLSRMKCTLTAASGIPPRCKPTFKAYFGEPDAEVDVRTLGFSHGAPPLLIVGSLTRGAVVCAVLDCVWQSLRTRPVRLYFGGGTIIPNVKGYTNQKVRNQGRINVHLAHSFFTEHGQQAIKDRMSSRGGVLIHEFTHALAGTVDAVGTSVGECKELAKRGQGALINAQSYAFFVDDTVGF
jgi:hypothetical protein